MSKIERSQKSVKNPSDPVVDVLTPEYEDRRVCMPLDPPERSEPSPPVDIKHPHKPRSPQSQREFYQNHFPEDFR